MGEEKNTKKIYKIIPVLIMIFIFVQSAFPADLSSRESGLIVSLVRHFWDADPETRINPDDNILFIHTGGLFGLFPISDDFPL